MEGHVFDGCASRQVDALMQAVFRSLSGCCLPAAHRSSSLETSEIETDNGKREPKPETP